MNPLTILTKGAAGIALEAVNAVLPLFTAFAAFLFWAASNVLTVAITYSFAPLRASPIIVEVWTMFRDAANVFFIFTLLVIAIATILRLESYGIKRLLPTIIIVALFINFSLLVTQYIIYPANWLAEDVFNLIKGGGGSQFTSSLGGIFYLQTLGNNPVIPTGGIANSNAVAKYGVEQHNEDSVNHV